MDFRQLETFVNVAKLKSFSKAAEKLYITQPTVTNHIQNLEKELGTILINRMGKKISLTKAGTLLYKNALNILNSFEMTKFELDVFKGQIQGHLEIASSSVPRKHLLPKIMSSFLKKYPDVTFTILENDSKQVINSIIDGDYDFGIVGAKFGNNNLEYLKIMNDRLVLITPLDFREDLNNFDTINIKELLKSNFILRDEGSGTREALQKWFKRKGIDLEDLKVIAYIEDPDCIKELVTLGAGVSIVSEKMISNEIQLDKIKALYIEDLNIEREFYFVYHKNRQLPPLGETFKNHILENSKNSPKWLRIPISFDVKIDKAA